MKKTFVLILLLLLLYPPFVLGVEIEEHSKSSDIYIEELKVEDFELSPTFNKFQNLYTIITDEYIPNLNIIIPDNENKVIDILGNENFSYGENTIQIIVTDLEDTKENTYTIIFTIKEETEPTFGEYLNQETEPEIIGQKEVSIIILSCFFLIMLFYKGIFARK